MRELEQANHGSAAADQSATDTELSPHIQQVSITRQEFITQIEPFKTSKPDFHTQLLQVFDNHNSLIELNLRANQIGDAGAQALATALEQNTSLTELNLFDNQIGAAGAQALAKALQTNSSLRVLDLSRNQIGNEGAQALVTALQTKSSLSTLALFDNQIGPEGAQALASALQTNSSLIKLSLGYNHIGDAGALAAIDNALVANNNTKELKSTQVEGQEAEKTGGSATEASEVSHVARLKCNKAESTQGL